MANEIEDMEVEEGQEEEEAPKQKKGKFKIILLAVLFVLALGIGGGYYFYGDKLLKKQKNGEEQAVEKKKHRAVGPIMALEPFLFNLSGNASKFAKVTVGVELKDPKVLEESKKMVPVMRDKILLVLGSKGAEVLMDVNSREVIKKEIFDSIKGLFKNEDDVNAIYITDIMIQ